MDTASVVTIIDQLNKAQVRYLVVGGLAIVAHGYVRFTADMDVVLDFETANLKSALRVLSDLGYKPRAPVAIEQFADANARQNWIEQKGLTVFSLWSTEHPMTEIDLFTQDPFDSFDESYKNAMCKEVAPDVSATFASLEDMIKLKSSAGRAQDLEDIQKLAAALKGPDSD